MHLSVRISLFCSASLILGLILGLAIPYYFDLNEKSLVSFREIRNKGGYQFINPLLECDQADFANDKNLDKLKKNIQDLVEEEVDKNNISYAAVYYRDLNNGPWFGINSTEMFSPSSLIKVPLLIAYLKLSETDPSILQKQLVNEKEYNRSSQNIPPQVTLDVGATYTVSELLDHMIIYSDNLAYDLLFENINNQKVVSIYTDLGIDLTPAFNNPNGDIITVKSYASFYRVLFNSSYLSKENSEKALKLLSQTKFNKGIVAGVPSNLIVSHKFGERQYLETHQKQLHDCGIVYSSKPYLICVMTRGQDFNKMATTIQNISRHIYNEVTR